MSETNETEINEIITAMDIWYSKKNYVYEMFFSNDLLHRETAALVPKHITLHDKAKAVRYLRVAGTNGFDYALNRIIKYKFDKIPLNLYVSLAAYKTGIPIMSPVLGHPSRKKMCTDWAENHWTQMTTYDCLVDVDSPDHDNLSMSAAKQSTFDIISHLNEYSVPYYLRFSGCGYHVIIPYWYFASLCLHFNPDKDVDNSIYCLFNDITQKLHDAYSDFVDTGLHDSRRICKMPYSICFYDDGFFVCWPFGSVEEFKGHHFEDYKLMAGCHFMGETTIYKRGQYCFNANPDNTSGLVGFLESLKLKKWVSYAKKKSHT